MNSVHWMRREILRLAASKHKAASFNIRRLSVFYNVPERQVCQELASLAEQKKITLARWDGKELKPFSAWASADEFVKADLCGGQVRIGIAEDTGS